MCNAWKTKAKYNHASKYHRNQKAHWRHLALQWCRENIVVPLGFEQNNQKNKQKLIIAIGNISYLGTIGDFIKRRAADKGMECVFVEKPTEEIQEILDNASQQRLISGDDLEGCECSADSSLDALKDADGDQSRGIWLRLWWRWWTNHRGRGSWSIHRNDGTKIQQAATKSWSVPAEQAFQIFT